MATDGTANRTPRRADDDDDDLDHVGLFPFDQLPPELQTHIFLALDLPSLAAAMRVSPTWCAMIEEPVMWKLKCLRDFPHYLEGAPLPEQDCVVPDEQNYKLTLDELEDAVSRGNEQALLRLIALIHRFTQTHADDENSTETEDADADETEVDAIAGDTGFSPLPERGGEAETAKNTEDEDTTQREEAPPQQQQQQQQQQETRDWKQFYRQCLGCPYLDGRWIGDYRSHGKELVHISHRGFRVLATKITGDANVPAGKPTWRMTMAAKGDRGKGQMHLADTGYTRPRWGRAYLEVVDKNNLVVKWFYGVHPSQHFDTYYERVKESGSGEADQDTEMPEGEVQEAEQGRDSRARERETVATGDSAAAGDDEEERERKRAKREVTESGFAFRLVRSPDTGQMYVLEENDGEEGHDEAGDVEQGEYEDDESDEEDSEDDFYEELVSTQHNGSEVDDAGHDDDGDRQ